VQIDWVRWGETAAALGLRLHDPTLPFSPSRSFRKNLLALGPLAAGDALPRHWMHGVWAPPPARATDAAQAPVEVLVVGEHTNVEGATVIRTYVAARIDPPLACGIALHMDAFPSPLPPGPARPHRWVPLPPRLSGWRAEAADPPRATAILGGAAELWERLVAARDDDVCITDSMAVVRADGFRSERRHVERMLASAASLARAFAERRPPRAGHAGHAGRAAARRASEWRAVADAARVSFDEERMALEGTLAGLSVTVGVEGEPAGLSTFAAALVPGLAGVRLRLSPQTVRDTLSVVLGGAQDIQVGRKAFDDAFLVRGYPEHDVRAVLEDAHVRHAFAALATGAVELVLGDGRLEVTWSRALDGEDLAPVVTALERIGARFGAKAVPREGPYR